MTYKFVTYMLEGVSSVAYFSTIYEESQQTRDSHFLICSVLFVSKGTLFDVYFTRIWVFHSI